MRTPSRIKTLNTVKQLIVNKKSPISFERNYEIALISVSPEQEINIENVKKFTGSNRKTWGKPVLFKQGNKFILYGSTKPRVFSLTEVDANELNPRFSDSFKSLNNVSKDDIIILSNKDIPNSIYEEITSKKAHLIPVIRSHRAHTFIQLSDDGNLYWLAGGGETENKTSGVFILGKDFGRDLIINNKNSAAYFMWLRWLKEFPKEREQELSEVDRIAKEILDREKKI